MPGAVEKSLTANENRSVQQQKRKLINSIPFYII